MNMRFAPTCLLSVTLIAVAPMAAYADMLSTSMVMVEAERNSRIELVERYMDREDVRGQMEAMGVDSALAAERVAGLSDRQLEQLALSIDTSPAGSGELGIIIAVLVILLLLEILGVTNIFKKV
jgi:hypothetical protein